MQPLMQPRQAVIVNEARLAGEFVKRVIERTSVFRITQEIEDLKELPSIFIDLKVDWVFVILTSEHEIPEMLKIELFHKCPTLRLIGLWVDSNRIRMERLVREQKDLTSLTLEELIKLLLDELQEQPQSTNGDAVGG